MTSEELMVGILVDNEGGRFKSTQECMCACSTLLCAIETVLAVGKAERGKSFPGY
jgi:hypothetical protein